MHSLAERISSEFVERAAERVSGAEQVRRVRDEVRRDLENLLNTRWRCVCWPPKLEELDRSLVNYGLPDFSGVPLNDRSQLASFRSIVEQAISYFEPRLRMLKVSYMPATSSEERSLRFRIDGTLVVADEQHSVIYESVLDTASAEFHVRYGRR